MTDQLDLVASLRVLLADERCLCSSAHTDWRSVDDLLDRLDRAELQVRRARAVLDCRLSNHHDSCSSWRRGFACDCWRAELEAAVSDAVLPFGCCDHCGCGVADREGHDDTCTVCQEPDGTPLGGAGHD